MAGSNDLFGMLQADDKLDGTNYAMWSYMMKHVLVAKQLWNIVADVDRRPGSSSLSHSSNITDGLSSSSIDVASSPPTHEQLRWDGKDAQAHALIALSVKRHIVPHIRSCSTSKQAWDSLASLYAVHNEAHVAYLRKQLENVCMAENDSVDMYVTCIKDFKEQLANIDDIISNVSLVSTLLKGLPESFQNFATTLRLVAKGNQEMYAFDDVVLLLLQEEQSRVNRSGLIEGTQALAISHKGKNKYASAFGSSRPKPQSSSSFHFSNDADSQKKKRCKYCRKAGHTIEECRKLAKRNEKKESGMSIVESSANAKNDEANMAQDFWACVVTCHYDATLHSKCMIVNEADSDWFFDSGASKHITSCKSFFVSLKDAPKGGHVVCANNASYPIIGVGEIELTSANGGVILLKNALYVPGIKKNLISVPLIAKAGLHVHFVDDKCKVHDLSNGDTIVMSGTLCNGLYRLDTYKGVASNALVAHTSSLTEMELWHARFGHLNFNSLLYLQKKDMVIGLPTLESIEKHACEGCILGKMHRASFPKDNHTHTTRKLQLVHSDVCGPIRTPSFGKHTYFVTFIDDATRHTWVYPMKAKNEVFSCFKKFLSMAQNFSSNKLLILPAYHGGEYTSHAFNAFLRERGISHQYTMPYTPQ